MAVAEIEGMVEVAAATGMAAAAEMVMMRSWWLLAMAGETVVTGRAAAWESLASGRVAAAAAVGMMDGIHGQGCLRDNGRIICCHGGGREVCSCWCRKRQ